MPAQSCWSAAGTAGVSGRPTGGTWRATALAAAVASPPWAPRPSRGGARPPPPWLASGRSRAGGGGEGGGRAGGEWGFPAVPPWSPCVAPWWSRGGGLVVPVLGGQPLFGGGALVPRPPPSLWVPNPRAGPRSGPLLSSLLPRGAGWPGGGEGRRVLGAAVPVSG